ncbi:transcriptional regulator [Micromonospora sediminicola]|uniref:tetratricopeptide repeat protein n=1 Tax=Micromonospora sediminicola TaxID=946078 RepID=UPI00340DD74C
MGGEVVARRPPRGQAGPLVHPLSVVRAERNWTYQDLVDAIARRAGNIANRREKAWRWENWGVVPDLISQLSLASELGVSDERVRLEPWPHWLPDGAPISACFDWTPSGGLAALSDAVEHAAVDCRGFMKMPGSVMVEIAQSWRAAETPQVAVATRGGQIGAAFVDRLEEGLPRLRMLEATHGGKRARKLIDAELGMVVEVLERSTYSENLGQQLYRLAAELGRMAGWASFDAGLHAAAQRYWVAAMYAAHVAGDRVLGSNVLKSMSLQCHDFGLPNEALALAQAANQKLDRSAPRVAAMFSLREARAHAALRDAPACERLLARADTLFAAAGTSDEEPSWLAYFDEAEFYAQIGTCYLDLGNAAKADDFLEKNLRLAPETKVRDRATYTTRRAAASAQLGNPDEAADLLSEAVVLIRQAPSSRNVRRVHQVRKLIRLPKDDVRLEELDESLATLIA